MDNNNREESHRLCGLNNLRGNLIAVEVLKKQIEGSVVGVESEIEEEAEIGEEYSEWPEEEKSHG